MIYRKQIRIPGRKNEKIIKKLFEPIKNADFFKPSGGLWSSTYMPDNYYQSDWIKFSKHIGYCPTGFTEVAIFDVYKDSRIYCIDCYNDLDRLVDEVGTISKYETITCINYENIKNYDVIWLTPRGESETRDIFPTLIFDKNTLFPKKRHSLFGWDSESSLILNFDVIHNIEYIEIDIRK